MPDLFLRLEGKKNSVVLVAILCRARTWLYIQYYGTIAAYHPQGSANTPPILVVLYCSLKILGSFRPPRLEDKKDRIIFQAGSFKEKRNIREGLHGPASGTRSGNPCASTV